MKKRPDPLAYFRGLPRRFVESIAAISSQGCEWLSIGTACAWIGPLYLYADFMHTTIYLEAINRLIPRVPFLCALIAMGCYQLCALLMPRPSKVVVGEHDARANTETRTRCEQVLKWLHFRENGQVVAAIAWSFMAFASGTVRITPGTGMFAMVAAFCVVGCFRLRSEKVSERKVLNDLDAQAESAMQLREYKIKPWEVASTAVSP